MFVLRLFKMVNRGLLSIFWWLRRGNHVQFIEECTMCTEKKVLVKKCLQMYQTWVCHYKPESKRHRKNSDFSAKKKFRAQLPVKKIMLTVFWDMKRFGVFFISKVATVNSVSYNQLLRQKDQSA